MKTLNPMTLLRKARTTVAGFYSRVTASCVVAPQVVEAYLGEVVEDVKPVGVLEQGMRTAALLAGERNASTAIWRQLNGSAPAAENVVPLVQAEMNEAAVVVAAGYYRPYLGDETRAFGMKNGRGSSMLVSAVAQEHARRPFHTADIQAVLNVPLEIAEQYYAGLIPEDVYAEHVAAAARGRKLKVQEPLRVVPARAPLLYSVLTGKRDVAPMADRLDEVAVGGAQWPDELVAAPTR